MKISTEIWTDPRAMADQSWRDAVGRPSFHLIAHGEEFDHRRTARCEAPTHVTSSCRGVLGPAGASGVGSVGAFTLSDSDGDFGTGVASFDEFPPRDAARRALQSAIADAGRAGEAPDLIWLSASPGCEEAVIAGLQDVVGGQTPILGGSAADDHVAGRWSVGSARAQTRNGVAVSALFPSTPVAYAFQSGYAPSGVSGVATAVDGRRVRAIDGRPAAEVYGGWLGRDDWRRPREAPLGILGATALAPLGREAARVADVPYHVLAHPAAVHPDGALELFADVAEGERLHLMTGSANSLIARAGRVAEHAVARSGLPLDRISGALLVFCGGCMMAVEDRMSEVGVLVDRALGGAPFLGVFTFGEQGPVLDGMNRHGNLMISCVVFGT